MPTAFPVATNTAKSSDSVAADDPFESSSSNPFEPSTSSGDNASSAIGKISSGGGGLGKFTNPNEKAFEPRTAWDVQPDPLAEPLDFAPPEKPMSQDLKLKSHADQLVFPHRPSYYAALATRDGGKEQIRILDVRSGRTIGRPFPGKLDHDLNHSALSADGKHIATALSFPESRILVADTKKGEVLQNIELNKDHRVSDVAFAGPRQLIAVVTEGFHETKAGVWDIVEGKPLATVDLKVDPEEKHFNRNYAEHSLTVSPGGKYFALLMDNVVCVYEAATGNLAGELELETDKHGGSGSGLAFSASGDQLAVVSGSFEKTISLIDVKTGEITSSTQVLKSEFDQIHLGRGGFPIQFLPEVGCFLLDGKLVVETSTGEGVMAVTAFDGPAKALPQARVVGIYEANRSGTVFGEFRLPKEDIARLAETLKSGGTLFDGLLGPAKEGDLSSAEILSIPPPGIDWKMEPIVRPEAAKREKTIKLPNPEDSFIHGTQPVLSLSGSKFAWLPELREGHSKLFAADVSTAKLEGDIEVLPNSRALDISPDGSLVLVAVTKEFSRDNAKARRLEVYSIPLKKHVLAWKVESAQTSDKNRPNAGNANLFAEAYFIEKNQVLTRQDDGRIVLWELPAVKAKYVLDSKSKLAGFSPGRRYALLHSQEQKLLRWLEVKTGKWCGEWAYDGWLDPALAFSPSGDKIAQVTTANGYTMVRLFSTADGKQIKEMVIPPLYSQADRLNWNEDRYLLIDSILLDLQKGAPVWRYALAGRPLIGPDGRYWWSHSDRGMTTLTPTQVPSDEVRKQVAKVKPKPIAPIIGPGSHISIQIGGLAGGLNPNDALQMLTEQVKARGWVVDANAPYRLFASSQEGSEQVTYESFGGRFANGARTQTVSVRKVTTTYRITDNSGKDVWKVEFGSSANAPFFISLQEGQNLQQEINKGFDASLRSSISGVSIPLVIFPQDAYQKLNQSILNQDGERIQLGRG
jgi:WD40 repeat protein